MKRLWVFLSIIFLVSFSERVFARTVRYELTATQERVNLSGKKSVDWALMINGSIPAPTLEFTEGDDAEIVVKNGLANDEVSIHWHGILLPPIMDGVAYVNTPPIHPGESFTFKFKIRQAGTYWYHSHTNVQEQKGLYGALIIHPKKPTIKVDREAVVVLSDWSDEDASQIIKNLRKDGEYYAYKKGTVRSYLGAIRAGGLKNHLQNEWIRMGGMDLSDVGYDAFLINGKRDSQLLVAHPGEKIRLRIINAAASSYFYVSLGKMPMTIISADGIDVEPRQANEVLMGMAETYDVLFEAPEHKNYELRATVQDGTGFASTWIGMGEKVPTWTRSQPDLYAAMDHGAHAGHAGSSSHEMPSHETKSHETHQKSDGKAAGAAPVDHDSHAHHVNTDHANMDHASHADHKGHAAPAPRASTGPVLETLGVDDLKALETTELPKTAPVHDIKLVLGGDMERYVWHINGKAIHEDRNIVINEGEAVRLTFVNDTMMHHPMHLHGHFFRVLNKSGAYSPLKHTVDVAPHTTRVIEFYANEPGEWMLHCHNLYHMKTGMARVVKYASFNNSPLVTRHQKHDPHLHDHVYFDGRLELATNHAQADLRLSKTWDTLEAHVETREYDNLDHIEGELLYRRWFSQYFNLIAGGAHFEEFREDKTHALLGVGYMLPMLVESNLFVDHAGRLRLDLEKRFQWTRHIYSDAEVVFRQRAKTEFEVSLMYANSWAWAAGLMFTEDSVGVGAEYRF